MLEGVVFNVQRFCLHDGPGIRTTLFLKGCPLRCQWCANPESLGAQPQLGFMRQRCDKCQKCVEVCPVGAIAIDSEGAPLVNRKICTACGDCVAGCYPEALVIYGKRRVVSDVFREVLRDKEFFLDTGGGMTVSGGEPLQQPEFVAALFRLCREAHVSTCMETSGYGSPESLQQILETTDVVLFDLKHLDSAAHVRLTGRSNELILRNARLVAAAESALRFRMPLIPGRNDDTDNIRATANFIKQVQKQEAVLEVMPYHALGAGKYETLNMPYPLQAVASLEPGFAQFVVDQFVALGVQCSVTL